MADRRIDITPQPAHFDHVAAPDRGVTTSDVMVVLLAIVYLFLSRWARRASR